MAIEGIETRGDLQRFIEDVVQGSREASLIRQVQGGVPTVTSLPSGPLDGQEVDLLVDTAGTYGGPFLWRCKYRAASGTYPWHVMGEPELFIENSQTAAIAATTSYADLPGSPNTLVLPNAGSYDVDVEAWIAAVGGQAYLSYTVGAGAAADPWSAQAGDAAGFYFAVTRKRRTTISAASMSLKMQVRRSAAGNIWADRARLSARPVRIA